MRYLKHFWLILTLLLLLSGCGGPGDDTLTLTISGHRCDELMKVMVEKFPEIDFNVEIYRGENASSYLNSLIREEDAGDIIYYTQLTENQVEIDHMLDLSGYPFMGNLSDEALSILSVDDRIYQIPGPLEIRCIVYNKTLFAERGWNAPGSFGELIALVERIRAEAPELTPIAMSHGGQSYPFVLVSTLSQTGFLSTPDGKEWEKAFFEGNASILDGMADGLTMTEQLIDADAFDPEVERYTWNCDREMIEREAAMYFLWGNMTSFVNAAKSEGVTDQFGFLPFYGLNRGEKLVGFTASSAWSLNRTLGEKGNEKKLENALKVMEWLTTEEAQNLLGLSRGQLPVIRGAEENDLSPYLAELWSLSEGGYKVSGVYTGYEHLIIAGGTIVQEAMMNRSSTGMREKFGETLDLVNRAYLNGEMVEACGELAEDLTSEETAQLCADAFHAAGLGDLAIISRSGDNGWIVNARGAAGKLYKGAVTPLHIRIMETKIGARLMTVEMTGAEIKVLMRDGKAVYEGNRAVLDGSIPRPADVSNLPTIYFDYYWSGMDREDLEDDEHYTVVFQEGDYPDDLVDRAVPADRLVNDALVEYFRKNSPIAAPSVNRE